MNKIKELSISSKQGFSLLSGINRPIIPSHVTKLAKSLDEMGCIRPVVVAKVPFIGQGNYIIDGQHLYHALIRNSTNIPYIEIEIGNEEDLIKKISLLNASSKSWAMIDYVIAWKFINKDYLKLETLYNTYDFDLTTIVSVIMNRSDGSDLIKIIKNGKLKIVELPSAIKLLDCMTDVMNVIPRTDRISMRGFLRIYIKKYREWGCKYDHEVFIDYLSTHKNKFKTISQDQEEISKLLDSIIK